MPRPIRVRPFAFGIAAFVLAALPGFAGNDPNLCDVPGESPDVIVGEIDDIAYWGSEGEISAFSFSTWSCNVGTCQLDWISTTNEHPVIAQNMFRLKDGRYEQIGQSWLKHGFFALSLELCDTGCLTTDGTHLGVNCADPYTADLNGLQSGLGPKWEVNASTGAFPYPFTDSEEPASDIHKRLQVRTVDISPGSNPGALYFVEGQYVTRDDAAAGNDNNNGSYRRVSFDDSAGIVATLEDEIVQQQPAIAAWPASESGVHLRAVNANDGRYWVGAKATDLGGGLWQYEYAVQNVNSHRSAQAFRVPVPSNATITEIGFHDVDYHSGELWSGRDWTAALENGDSELVWRSESFAQNGRANALRWGTLYNFRFVADVPPAVERYPVALEMYRPGQPTEFTVEQTVPMPCDGDGICDATEDCLTCPADCLVPGEGCCGDSVCEPAESGCDCPLDCGACLAGGAISDGSSGPGKPLMLSLAPGGSELVLDWDPSCMEEDVDYAVYRGLMGNFASHLRHACTTGGATTTTVPRPGFSAYYLIAPTNGAIEGSLGADSEGALRPPAIPTQACYPRQVAECPADGG